MIAAIHRLIKLAANPASGGWSRTLLTMKKIGVGPVAWSSDKSLELATGRADV
jgi:hypothetical protein